MSRIYVASSWRNERQPGIVALLHDRGHEVYDFRNPPHGEGGFHWSEIDPDWKDWSPAEYQHQLTHSPIAAKGFNADAQAMEWADTCVLVNPCGRSAHLEMGWFVGRSKKTVILLEDGEPELMYLLVDHVVTTGTAMLSVLREGEPQ